MSDDGSSGFLRWQQGPAFDDRCDLEEAIGIRSAELKSLE